MTFVAFTVYPDQTIAIVVGSASLVADVYSLGRNQPPREHARFGVVIEQLLQPGLGQLRFRFVLGELALFVCRQLCQCPEFVAPVETGAGDVNARAPCRRFDSAEFVFSIRGAK